MDDRTGAYGRYGHHMMNVNKAFPDRTVCPCKIKSAYDAAAALNLDARCAIEAAALISFGDNLDRLTFHFAADRGLDRLQWQKRNNQSQKTARPRPN